MAPEGARNDVRPTFEFGSPVREGEAHIVAKETAGTGAYVVLRAGADRDAARIDRGVAERTQGGEPGHEQRDANEDTQLS